MVAEKLEDLAAQKKRHQEALAELLEKESSLLEPQEVLRGIEERLVAFKKALPKAKAPLLKRLIRNMYDVVLLNQGRIEGFYLTANQNPAFTPSPKTKTASGNLPDAVPTYLLKPTLNQSIANWHISGRKFAYCLEWWPFPMDRRTPSSSRFHSAFSTNVLSNLRRMCSSL